MLIHIIMYLTNVILLLNIYFFLISVSKILNNMVLSFQVNHLQTKKYKINFVEN